VVFSLGVGLEFECDLDAEGSNPLTLSQKKTLERSVFKGFCLLSGIDFQYADLNRLTYCQPFAN
jgi:hypothetical protein